MSDSKELELSKKIVFEPSTIETIDESMVTYLEDLNLFTNTNKGWKKVPVMWGSAERSFQSKEDKDIRDSKGMLKLPIITVSRVSFSKNKANRGSYQGLSPEHADEQGGSLTVSRTIYQEKTQKFANADALRLQGQSNYPVPNAKVVYRTISVPMPVNVEVEYEIAIRTEYQQQMNDLMLPFVTKPGRINAITLKNGTHLYEGFIGESFTSNNNVADFSTEERKFETKISIVVIAYLIGEGPNRERPYYAVRENAVEVKIPRERISLSEIPEHEYGKYYGLSGIPITALSPASQKAYLFSNVPAASKGVAASTAVGSEVVTTENFREILAQSFTFMETLLAKGATVPAENKDAEGAPTFTISNTMKPNTEAVYYNGLIQARGALLDYTVDGQKIIFTEELDNEELDEVYITYIIG